MKRLPIGLTVVEVAIAMAATVLLFTVAVPAYQSYALRGVVAEAVDLAAPAKATVEEYTSFHQKLPGARDISLPFVTSKYVSSTAWSAKGDIGTITITTQAAASNQQSALEGKVLVLTAQYNAQTKAVTWLCGGTPATTVDPQHLPSNCKA